MHKSHENADHGDPVLNPVIDIIEGRQRDLGGFSVRRVPPITHRKNVRPFIFFDHMDPADFPAGSGMDVRPHPHIGLAPSPICSKVESCIATASGNAQMIEPGAVNWMAAGRGIVHSERTAAEDRARGMRMNDIQSWIWLPEAEEECAPEFEHYPSQHYPSQHYPRCRPNRHGCA